MPSGTAQALLCRPCERGEHQGILPIQSCKCPCRVAEVLRVKVSQLQLCCSCQFGKQQRVWLASCCRCPSCVCKTMRSGTAQALLCCPCQHGKQQCIPLPAFCKCPCSIGNLLRCVTAKAPFFCCLGSPIANLKPKTKRTPPKNDENEKRTIQHCGTKKCWPWVPVCTISASIWIHCMWQSHELVIL